MKKLMGILLLSCMHVAWATSHAQVFVSFSMPAPLLKQTLMESARLEIPAILNGLYHNSMSETAVKIMALAKDVSNLNLQIDPTAFERFGIHQVPALVVAEGSRFDVIYGNLTLQEGLARMGKGVAHE